MLRTSQKVDIANGIVKELSVVVDEVIILSTEEKHPRFLDLLKSIQTSAEHTKKQIELYVKLKTHENIPVLIFDPSTNTAHKATAESAYKIIRDLKELA